MADPKIQYLLPGEYTIDGDAAWALVRRTMQSARAARAAMQAAADPWALPAGLEWYVSEDDDESKGKWAVRSIDRTTAVVLLCPDVSGLLALMKRRQADDPPMETATPEFAFVDEVCPDCKGSRIYVGLGFFPAEQCARCCGKGTIRTAVPNAPMIRKLAGELVLDPWALPAEAQMLGLKWRKGWSWEVSNDAAAADPWAPDAIQLYEAPPGSGTLAGHFDDLSPLLRGVLFDLIQKRNKAEPNGMVP